MKTSLVATLLCSSVTLPFLLLGCGDKFEDCHRSLRCPDDPSDIDGGAGGAGQMQNDLPAGGEGPTDDDEIPECETGDTESFVCGINERGEQTQTCVDSLWQDKTECDDPDECIDGEEDEIECGRSDLGIAQRTCLEGQWSEKLCRHPDGMISAGSVHTCAVLDTGKVYCWGLNQDGGLGIGNADHGLIADVPVEAMGLSNIVAIAAGGETNPGGSSAHTCALDNDGKVSCWGRGTSGQLGHGTSESSDTPVEVASLEPVVKLATGPGRSCAMDEEGKVACWGSRTNDLAESNTPRLVAHLPIATDLAVGNTFFTVSELGQLYSWSSGGLAAAPSRLGAFDDFTAVSAANSHTCAIRAGGLVACWGSNNTRQLGEGVAENSGASAPVTVPGVSNAVTLAAGGAVGVGHVCSVNTEGKVHCWGQGGALGGGDPDAENTPIPTQVVGLNDAISIAAGQAHTCAMRADHSIVCWGVGSYGELGYGGTNNQHAPVAVDFSGE